MYQFEQNLEKNQIKKKMLLPTPRDRIIPGTENIYSGVSCGTFVSTASIFPYFKQITRDLLRLLLHEFHGNHKNQAISVKSMGKKEQKHPPPHVLKIKCWLPSGSQQSSHTAQHKGGCQPEGEQERWLLPFATD